MTAPANYPNTHVPDRSDPATLRIRVATTDDMDEIMRLAIAASGENGFLPAAPDLLAKEIWPALVQDHGLCGVIGQPGGRIEGLVLLRIGQMWYSRMTVIEEKAIFIWPEFRSAKGGRARKLCEFSKMTSDRLGLPLVIGVLSNSRQAAKVRLYTRVFGEPAGGFWLYNCRTGAYGHQAA